MRGKRFGVLLGIGVLIVGSISYYHPFWNPSRRPEPNLSPVLECPASVEVGPVEHGSVTAAEFVVRNRGGGQLVLNGFRTNCSCESVEVQRPGGFVSAAEVRLGPNEAVVMRLVLSIDGRGKDALLTHVYFRTNTPECPETLVVVSVPRILAGLTAVPSAINFGVVQTGKPVVRVVHIRDARTPPRKLARVETRGTGRVAANLTTAAEESHDPASTERGLRIGSIRIVVDTTTPGAVAGDVLVYSDDGATTPEIIRVTGRIAAPVEVSPSDLYLPRSSSTGPIYSGTFLVRSTAIKQMELAPTEVPSGVKVSVGEPSPANPGSRTVTVELTAGFVQSSGIAKKCSVGMSVTVDGQQLAVELPIHLSPKDVVGQP